MMISGRPDSAGELFRSGWINALNHFKSGLWLRSRFDEFSDLGLRDGLGIASAQCSLSLPPFRNTFGWIYSLKYSSNSSHALVQSSVVVTASGAVREPV